VLGTEKVPLIAGPSPYTVSHNFLTVSPFAPLFTNVLEKLSEKSLRYSPTGS
jgi:hypothetical protein